MKEREGIDSNVAVTYQTIQLINYSIDKPDVPTERVKAMARDSPD